MDIIVQPRLTKGWSDFLPPWGCLLLASAAPQSTIRQIPQVALSWLRNYTPSISLGSSWGLEQVGRQSVRRSELMLAVSFRDRPPQAGETIKG